MATIWCSGLFCQLCYNVWRHVGKENKRDGVARRRIDEEKHDNDRSDNISLKGQTGLHTGPHVER